MSRHVELHRIRLDVLLWVLGGFAESRPEPYRERGCLLTEEQRAALKAIARHPQTRRGELKRLAQNWDRSSKSLHVIVSRLRAGSALWTSWMP